MRGWHSGHSAGAVFAALLLLASAASAEAVVTRTPYQRYVNRDCPSNSLNCIINFPVIAANYRLELTNASCYVRQRIDQGVGSLYALQLLTTKASTGAIVSAVNLVPQLIAEVQGANRIYSSNDPVTAA